VSDWPLVSLVTPVLNGAATIRRTIDSVLGQDYPNLEYLVLDAGSTDGTLDILRAYGERLTWHSEPDQGQSDAINKGLARTSGVYLNWLSADDFLLPRAIRHLVELLQANPDVPVAYGRVNLVHADGTFWEDDRNVRDETFEFMLHLDNFILQPAALFTRDAWQTCGPLVLDYHYAMDRDFWIKIGRHYPRPWIYTPRTLADVTATQETKSASGGLPRLHEIRRIIESHGGRAPHAYYRIGLWHYQRGEMRQARHYFRIARARQPAPYIGKRLVPLILKSYLGGRVMDVLRAGRARLGF
jgi:glycosyltransferase involved in cell wall biosynthesis